MSAAPSLFVLFNPAAGRGRGGARMERFLSLLRDRGIDFDHAVTRQAGEEVELLDRALAHGYTGVVAVGGDGTWSVAADRIVRSGRRDVRLGLLPAGTGCDFGKSLGITWERAEQMAAGMAAGKTTTIDVGWVEGRHFLNVVGLGFDIAVIDDAERMPLLKGDLLYRTCAVRQLFRFAGLPLEVGVGEERPGPEPHLMLVVANARIFGGSFRIAPAARLDDGLLDAVSILDAGPITRARLLSKVSKGTHERDERVRIRQAPRFVVGLPSALRYEVDGEVLQARGERLEIRAVPAALQIYLPAD